MRGTGHPSSKSQAHAKGRATRPGQSAGQRDAEPWNVSTSNIAFLRTYLRERLLELRKEKIETIPLNKALATSPNSPNFASFMANQSPKHPRPIKVNSNLWVERSSEIQPNTQLGIKPLSSRSILITMNMKIRKLIPMPQKNGIHQSRPESLRWFTMTRR